MSTILEALDMMYEVKGDAELYYHKKDYVQKSASSGNPARRYMADNLRKNLHDPYSKHNPPMRDATDYRNRVKSNKIENDYNRSADENSKYLRDKRKAKNECTETIDTLEGILS